MFGEDDEVMGMEDFILKATTYPQKGDKLFITNTGGHYISCLNFQNDHLLLYIIGYKDAGDTLVKTMKKDTSYLDTFLFPAIFLYRNYLELSLKVIIRDGNILLDKPHKFLGEKGQIEYYFPRGHNLDKLWGICEDILEQVDKKYPGLKMFQGMNLVALGDLFAEFSHEDPGSDAARYPVDLKNNSTFPNWKYLDMFNMMEIIGKIDNYFKGVYSIFMEGISIRQEMETDYS